jgi:hypothetical protein
MRLSILGLLLLLTPVFAGTIMVDEFGNGLPFRIGTDPGPGGLANVLIYTLPFVGLQGDVLISNATEGLGDLIRFNGDSTMIFYSDSVLGDPKDAPADTPTPPAALYPNVAAATEVGPENNNLASYTPTANQPGFDASAPAYILVSDGQIPEPSTLVLMAFGLGLMAISFTSRAFTSQNSPRLPAWFHLPAISCNQGMWDRLRVSRP